MVAPTGTPPEVVNKVNGVVNAFLRATGARPCFEQNALQGVGGSPEDLKTFIASELAKWKPVIETAKIRCR